MSKILLISDIHFGCKNNNEKFLEIIECFFKETLKKVIKTYNITDVRILGDLFDNRNTINVKTLNSVMTTFKWYMNHMPSVHFKILLGNHDIYYHNRLDINSVQCLSEYTNVTIIDTIQEEKIDGKSILMVPWIIKDSEVYTKFNEIKINKQKYDLCLGHFEINGFHEIVGHVCDKGEDQDSFNLFKNVFSGHFHLRSTQRNITYLGSPYQINWNDCGDQKGIHIFDLKTEQTTFIPNNDSPIFVKININDILEKNNEKLRLIKGNNIKLVINKKYDEVFLSKLYQKIEALGAISLSIDNNFIDIISLNENENITETNFENIKDPMNFLIDFIKNIDIEQLQNIDKETLIKYIIDVSKNNI